MAYDLSTYEGRQQARDDAAAAGKSVVVDANGIYDRGSGQTTAGSPAPAKPTTPAVPGANPVDLSSLQNFFGQTAGFSREELAEKKRQFDEQMALYEREWQRQGLPELEIKQRLAALEEQKFQEQVQEFRSSQGLDYLKTAATLGGPASYFQQADFLRGARQRGDVPTFLGALAQNTQLPSFTGAGTASMVPQTAGGLTLQLGGGQAATIPTSTSAFTTPTQEQAITQRQQELIGHGMPAEQAGQTATAEYNQGYLQSGNVAYGTNVRFTAPPPVAAAPAGAVPAAMPAPAAGLGTDQAGYSYDQALNQIGSIFKAGPTSVAPGSLERLDPNELALLKSGATKLGYDSDAWLRAYGRAGIGQTAGSVA